MSYLRWHEGWTFLPLALLLQRIGYLTLLIKLRASWSGSTALSAAIQKIAPIPLVSAIHGFRVLVNERASRKGDTLFEKALRRLRYLPKPHIRGVIGSVNGNIELLWAWGQFLLPCQRDRSAC